uniref:cancer/testis antigen 55-like n=1 Tax=Arvicanthis niloticus TaxID=61156 RepID=UPI001487219F|nr:cancer/testis antigen 55-like [Arvicanthis niloticus]
MPLNIGTNVLALVEENQEIISSKQSRIQAIHGDLLLVEYSMNPGTANMNIHSASPLNSHIWKRGWETLILRVRQRKSTESSESRGHCSGWWRSQHCTPCTTLYSGCFHGKNMSEETSQEHHIDNSKFKSIQGVVTSLCNDYGWINETIFFNMNLISDNMPLNIGTNVLALVEENPRNHIFKAIKVKAMNNLPEGSEPSKLGRRLCIKCVTSVTEDNIYISKDTFFPLCMFSGGFRPFNGDLLLVEYSMNPGTANMNIHSASPLNSQNMEEVCVTSIDGRNGMVESTIFFTLDSLHIPSGYIPGLYDIVDVVAVDTMQPHCSWRAVSMTPLEMVN